MRAVVLDGGFGFDNLRLEERDRPEPGPGEVLVRIGAVSLNYRDVLLADGIYNPGQAMPVVPVSDCAGVVEAAGAGVTRLKLGDRVVNLFVEGWMAGAPDAGILATIRGGPGGDGVLSEYAVFSEAGLLPVPESLSLAEAATLPCAGLTAWSAVVENGGVSPGGSVLVEGTGGVALFALQFAKLAGYRVAVVSSSDEKLQRIAHLGADVAVNYRTLPKWSGEVRERMDPGGVDLVVELGGAATLENALRSVRPGGTIALIGVLSGAKAPLNLPLAVMRQVRLQGITCGSRDQMIRMLAAIETHGVKPWIHQRFAFEDFMGAFELMKQGGHIGKIVIEVDKGAARRE